MAEETTKELSNDDILRALMTRTDQLFALVQQLFTQQQEMNARLIKVAERFWPCSAATSQPNANPS